MQATTCTSCGAPQFAALQKPPRIRAPFRWALYMMAGLFGIAVLSAVFRPAAPEDGAAKDSSTNGAVRDDEADIAARRAQDGIARYMADNHVTRLEMESRSGMSLEDLTAWVGVYLRTNKTSDPASAINDMFHTAQIFERAAQQARQRQP